MSWNMNTPGLQPQGNAGGGGGDDDNEDHPPYPVYCPETRWVDAHGHLMDPNFRAQGQSYPVYRYNPWTSPSASGQYQYSTAWIYQQNPDSARPEEPATGAVAYSQCPPTSSEPSRNSVSAFALNTAGFSISGPPSMMQVTPYDGDTNSDNLNRQVNATFRPPSNGSGLSSRDGSQARGNPSFSGPSGPRRSGTETPSCVWQPTGPRNSHARQAVGHGIPVHSAAAPPIYLIASRAISPTSRPPNMTSHRHSRSQSRLPPISSSASHPPESYAGILGTQDRGVFDSASHILSSSDDSGLTFEPIANQLYLEMTGFGEEVLGRTDLTSFYAYLHSGQFERNARLSQERDVIAIPGVPLRDFDRYLAERSGQPRRGSHSQLGDPLVTPAVFSRTRTRISSRNGASDFDSNGIGNNASVEQDVIAQGNTNGTSQAARRVTGGGPRLPVGARRHRRATRAFLESLTEFDVDTLPADDRRCHICLEDLGVPEPINGRVEGPVRLPCGHCFGKSCICIWMEDNYTCPACRDKVESEWMYKVTGRNRYYSESEIVANNSRVEASERRRRSQATTTRVIPPMDQDTTMPPHYGQDPAQTDRAAGRLDYLPPLMRQRYEALVSGMERGITPTAGSHGLRAFAHELARHHGAERHSENLSPNGRERHADPRSSRRVTTPSSVSADPTPSIASRLRSSGRVPMEPTRASEETEMSGVIATNPGRQSQSSRRSRTTRATAEINTGEVTDNRGPHHVGGTISVGRAEHLQAQVGMTTRPGQVVNHNGDSPPARTRQQTSTPMPPLMSEPSLFRSSASPLSSAPLWHLPRPSLRDQSQNNAILMPHSQWAHPNRVSTGEQTAAGTYGEPDNYAFPQPALRPTSTFSFSTGVSSGAATNVPARPTPDLGHLSDVLSWNSGRSTQRPEQMSLRPARSPGSANPVAEADIQPGQDAEDEANAALRLDGLA